MFALMAWPAGGFAEMAVAVFDTEQEARTAQVERATKFPRWNFRVTEAARQE